MKLTTPFYALAITAGLGLAWTPVAAQEDGLTIVWAEDSNSDALYDPRVTQSRHEMQVIIQVFDTLIADDGSGEFYPLLAESWDISEDNTQIRMVLRDDVVFHDGTPFDAEAVQFTLDSIVDPETGSQAAIDILGPYERTEIVGPHEIVVHFEQPFPSMLSAFTEYYLSIVSPTAVETLGNTGFAQAPVGTGPFKFVQWDRGTQILLERNEDYAWAPAFFDNEGPSQVAQIVHRFIPNAGTRVAALEAGEVTLTDLTPPLDMRRLDDTDGFSTMTGTVSGVPFSMMFNIEHSPLSEIEVRKAVMMAVDRDQLANNLFFGYSTAALGPLASTTAAYWDGVEDYYPFDPDGAAALLEEAGWTVGANGIREKDGEPLSIHYLSMLEPETSVALQAELQKVGIHLEIDSVVKARQDELIMTNAYNMGAIRWVSTAPSVLRIPFHSSNIPEPGVFKFNWMRIASDELDGLIESAASAATLEDQNALYADIQKFIMDEAIFWPLYDQIQTIAYSDEITGVRFAPGQWQVRFYDIRPAD